MYRLEILNSPGLIREGPSCSELVCEGCALQRCELEIPCEVTPPPFPWRAAVVGVMFKGSSVADECHLHV